MRNYFKRLQKSKGFTLIELLVVIGILGILAATVLVAINPLEQLARGRDAGRSQTINGLGHGVQAYFTQQGSYILESNDWQGTLATAGEINGEAVNPSPTGYVACGPVGQVDNGYCYDLVVGPPTAAAIYARAESISYRDKALAGAGTLCASTTWIVWSSFDGKTGLLCQAGNPAATGATLSLLDL